MKLITYKGDLFILFNLFLHRINYFVYDSITTLAIPHLSNLRMTFLQSEKYPTVLWDTKLLRIWYKKDDVFKEPKTTMIFHFIWYVDNKHNTNLNRFYSCNNGKCFVKSLKLHF